MPFNPGNALPQIPAAPPAPAFNPSSLGSQSGNMQMAPDQTEMMIANIANSARSGKFDAGAIIDAHMRASRPTAEERAPLDDPAQEKWRMLLDASLGMMEAGSKPGATFFGSAGSGAKEAMSSSEKRRDRRQEMSEKKRQQMLDRILFSAGIAEKGHDNTFRNDQASILNKLRSDQFEHRKSYDNEMLDIKKKQSEGHDPYAKITAAGVSKIIANHNPVIDPTPIQDKVNQYLQQMGSLRGGGNIAGADGGGMGGGTSAPPASGASQFQDMTDKQAQDLISEFQRSGASDKDISDWFNR
ncbi:MAG: hypothetical protein ACXWYM_00235 [Candidatus Binatia bacterium]